MALEIFVLEDFKKWHSEIVSELDAIQEDIDIKKERMRIIEAKMFVIRESNNELGVNPERREKHWVLYGKPLELEYEKIEQEISLTKNIELAEKKKSLDAIRYVLDKTIKAN